MNLRERLADWISGGALSRAESREAATERYARNGYYGLRDAKDALERRQAKLRATLGLIAACETPNANATVRRMARIAREALK